MKDLQFQLQQIYGMTGAQNSIWERGECSFFVGDNAFNPLFCDKALRDWLFESAKGQPVPFIGMEQEDIFFCCICREETCCVLGPVLIQAIPITRLRQFYRQHNMKLEMEKPLPIMGFSKMISMFKLVIYIFCGETYDDHTLIEANQIGNILRKLDETRMIQFQISKEEEEEAHHTYREEQALLDCIREGRTDDALRLNMQMDNELGRMSRNEALQWQKLVVVAITLCTRAAIEGGMSPGKAYMISDYYIQQIDECKNIPSLVACRNNAVASFCEHVKKLQNRPRYSNYVEQCRDYVEKHYREKILLEEMAGQMGISPTYLSRIFSKEMGMRLQDYIIQFRVERAANLLIYSQVSIGGIGDYVNFPSQSYFGKVFKKYKHMTPKEYRDRYKPKEFNG